MKNNILLKAILFVLVLTLAGSVLASNMGFKLNLGTIHAVNQLLYGSGVSVSQVTDNNVPAKTSLIVNLDLANQILAPENSNMGFKLNIMSIPPDGLNIMSIPSDGLLVKTPNGTFYIKPDGSVVCQ